MSGNSPARSLIERAIERIATGDRARFPAALAWELTLAGRTLYPPHSTPEYEAAKPQIGINEALHRTAEQLQAALGDGSWAAPDDQLIDYLIGHARRWGQGGTVLHAIERTLAPLERHDGKHSQVDHGGGCDPADDRDG